MSPPPAPRIHRRLLLLATLLSGAAALVYETLWTRAFAVIVGSTVHAAAATFAAFLVGLALGAWLWGRHRLPIAWTVRAYLVVEVAIAATAPLVGLLIHRRANGLAAWFGTGLGPDFLSMFGMVLLLVLLPTLLMGATFPLVLVAARRLGGGLSEIGRFYAINTAGAAAGTLVCGFVLIRFLGVEASYAVGAAANLAAAALCLPLLRAPLRDEAEAPGLPEAPPTETEPAPWLPQGLLLGVAASSGFVVLALEIVWTRFASYFLGNRTFAFTTLLACVLLLLSAGSWLSARLVARFGPRRPELFGGTLVLSAAAILGSAAAGWWWIRAQSGLEAGLPGAGGWLLVYRALETFVLLAPPLVALGCLFPMSLMCARLAERATGAAAGRFYLVNTAGSVCGSLGAGFWGLSALGAFGSVRALAWVTAALAIAVFAWAFARERRRVHLAGLAGAAAVAVAVPFALPGALTLLDAGEELLYRTEDEYGVMQVVRRPDGLVEVTNNRTELIYYLGLVSTSYVQQMQGHLGMFHHPDASSALVLGSGYGITAGALTVYPQMRAIDAVEILPGMVEAADLFRPYNFAYHRDRRVRVVVDDARHFLATSDRRYDIVSINVSDPHLPGGSSLFHTDFYEVVKKHLEPGGVVLQHAFGSDIDIVIRTLLVSFDHVRAYRAYANGYNVVAADRPLEKGAERADALRDAPSVARALAGIGMLPPLTPGGVLRAGIAGGEIGAWLDMGGPVASDDHPALEFAWHDDPALLLFSNE